MIYTSLNPVKEERLRNNCWLQAVSGRYKGRVYEFGRINCQDAVLVATYKKHKHFLVRKLIQMTLLNLYNDYQQVSIFNTWIPVFIYLPPEAVATAQHIFQQLNTLQSNTQHNQMQDNDDEQQNSPGQDYNYYYFLRNFVMTWIFFY